MTKRKIRKLGIRAKIWIVVLGMVAMALAAVYLFGVVFLEKYYVGMKKNAIVTLSEQIIKEINQAGLLGEDQMLTDFAMKNNICIDIGYSNGMPMSVYEGIGGNCFVHQSLKNRAKLIRTVYANPTQLIVNEIVHPQYDTRYFVCGQYSITEQGEDYIVLITATLAPVNEATQTITQQLGLISLLLLVIATVVAFLASGIITRPVNKLSDAARSVAEGDLTVQISNTSQDELGELSDTFNHMVKQLKASDTLQKELIANVSHDLRTPLTMIRGYAESIRDLVGDNKEKREKQLDIIIDETDRLSALVKDIMDLSLMQAGKVKMNPVLFDIAATVREALERFSYLVESQGFQLLFQGKTSVQAVGDEFRIGQVLYNFINNAVAHIGEDKTIIVTVEEKPTVVRIEVTDHGEGIPADDLPLLWDRYYKPYRNAQGENKGTGLGLSIVKAVLVEHGANFGVSSEVGKGSTFWFEVAKG